MASSQSVITSSGTIRIFQGLDNKGRSCSQDSSPALLACPTTVPKVSIDRVHLASYIQTIILSVITHNAQTLKAKTRYLTYSQTGRSVFYAI